MGMGKMRTLNSAVTILLLLALVAPGGAWARRDRDRDTSPSSSDDVDAARDELADLKKEEKDTRERIRLNQDTKRRLDDPMNQDQEFAPTRCSCRTPACADTLYTAASIAIPAADADPASNCTSLYQTGTGTYASLPVACKNAVNLCGPVALEIRKKQLDRQIADDNYKLEHDFKDRRKELASDLRDALRNCSDCRLKAQQEAMGYNKPGVGDYLIGGLSAITPMVLGGMNMYNYSQGLNAQTGMYQNYLNQCVQVGVPCAGPGGMGGGMGMGMGGYGMGKIGRAHV